jgi:hypothetical protein
MFDETKGESYSRKLGVWSRIWQLFDYVSRGYAKLVVAPDGYILKYEKGPLTDQSLHGPQKSPIPEEPIRDFENLP